MFSFESSPRMQHYDAPTSRPQLRRPKGGISIINEPANAIAISHASMIAACQSQSGASDKGDIPPGWVESQDIEGKTCYFDPVLRERHYQLPSVDGASGESTPNATQKHSTIRPAEALYRGTDMINTFSRRSAVARAQGVPVNISSQMTSIGRVVDLSRVDDASGRGGSATIVYEGVTSGDDPDAGCDLFEANVFREDMCKHCRKKKDKHKFV